MGGRLGHRAERLTAGGSDRRGGPPPPRRRGHARGPPRCGRRPGGPGGRPYWATGRRASRRAGLIAGASTPPGYAAIMPVDTPDVGADVVARVLAAALAAPSGLARAVFHNTPGHPVVITHKHWNAISGSAAGDSGARAYLTGRNDMVCVTCDDLATGVDRDFPATTAR
nr:NTP transferase domain-containing protein [Nocardia abscessus]